MDHDRPTDRYDSLLGEGLTADELSRRRLLRVSPEFMVIALGLPTPRFAGAALDPPLRSRFQARAVSGALSITEDMRARVPPSAGGRDLERNAASRKLP